MGFGWVWVPAPEFKSQSEINCFRIFRGQGSQLLLETTVLVSKNLGSLCSSAKQKYRVMEEKKRGKSSFIALSGKGEHRGLMPQELCLGLCWGLRQWRICLECRRPGFDPRVGKIPWRREWQPTPDFLPGESHGQRSLVGRRPWGHKSLTRLSD